MKLNAEKVFSISIGIGVAKAIWTSLTALSFYCDFSICTFMFFKSKQCNACGFCVLKKYNQTDAEFQELFDQLFSETVMDEYIDFDIEVVTSLSAIDPRIVE